jgi:hypothetical protein
MNYKPIINSFIYRKKVKYGYSYFAVDLITEKVIHLSNEIESFITSDYEIVLTDIAPLDNQKYKILPLHRGKIPIPLASVDVLFDGREIAAASLTKDELITVAFKAAKIFIDLKKQLENE